MKVGLVREGLFREPGDNEPEALVSEEHAETTPSQGQNQRFGEQLADDAAPAGPHRGTHGEFMLTRGAASEQKNRDIAATNGQQQSYGAKKQIECLADGVRHPIAQVLYLDLCSAFWVVVGCLFCELLEIGLQFSDCDFRLDSSFYLHERAVLLVWGTGEF